MTPKLETVQLNFYYGSFHALKNVSMRVRPCAVTAIIGPSGCGKSTLIRVFNRMNDLVEGARTEGQVLIDGKNIYAEDADTLQLRRKVGMVFQRPNPFPLSVFENIAFGLRIQGLRDRRGIEARVESSLRATFLWDDLKDQLNVLATALSPEQQQRLCISRLLVMEPDVLLLDEPCSTLDPIATQRIEELTQELKKNYTIVIVTHNMQQAARISDEAGFMLLGELIEFGPTPKMFTNPSDKRTEDYVTGRYG
jgi:phosphate transport system ATP-binding protein